MPVSVDGRIDQAHERIQAFELLRADTFGIASRHEYGGAQRLRLVARARRRDRGEERNAARECP